MNNKMITDSNFALFNCWKIIKKTRKKKNNRLQKLILLCQNFQVQINKILLHLTTESLTDISLVTPIQELNAIPEDYWERTMMMTDKKFQKEYRTSKTTFKYLCNELYEGLFDNDFKENCEKIPIPKSILISLHILKSNCELSTIAELYEVKNNDVEKFLIKFCTALVNKLYTKVINFPETEKEREYLVENFMKNWNFPNTFGSLDGCHISIKNPTNNGIEFYNNYMKYYSIILLALCDDQYCFRYANMGKPGSAHYSSVFRDSQLYQFLKNLNSKNHIIADGAFPLMMSLMKPYPENDLTLSEENFNFRLNSARMTIEDSFGRLKARWRCLIKQLNFSLDHNKLVLKSCLILHNLCERNKDHFYSEWLEGIDIIPSVAQKAILDMKFSTASTKRDELAASFYIINE